MNFVLLALCAIAASVFAAGISQVALSTKAIPKLADFSVHKECSEVDGKCTVTYIFSGQEQLKEGGECRFIDFEPGQIISFPVVATEQEPNPLLTEVYLLTKPCYFGVIAGYQSFDYEIEPKISMARLTPEQRKEFNTAIGFSALLRPEVESSKLEILPLVLRGEDKSLRKALKIIFERQTQ